MGEAKAKREAEERRRKLVIEKAETAWMALLMSNSVGLGGEAAKYAFRHAEEFVAKCEAYERGEEND